MKICFIASANAIHSRIWISHFANKRNEIHWISLDKTKFEDLTNVKYYYLKKYPLKSFSILFNLRRIRRLLNEIRPSLLHSHYAGVNGLLGALSGFHPYILTAWGSDVLIVGNNIIKKILLRFIFNKAELITCNGEYFRSKIELYGINREKISLINWGIDTRKFQPIPFNKKLKERFKKSEAIIISLRNLEPIYDIESLVYAVPEVLREYPNTEFLIIGIGSQEFMLRRIVSEMCIENNVTFVGWLSHDELVKYFSISDLYVSTSLSDGGLSQSTGQAMAMGIPIICTDLEVYRSILIDGENGILVPMKSPSILAEKIIFLLKNKVLREKLGKNGKRTIENELNFGKEMDKVAILYENVIKSYNQSH